MGRIIKINEETIEAAVLGGAVLGGGGGGWIEEGRKIAKLAFEKGFSEILPLEVLSEEALLLTVSAVGAPSTGSEMLSPDDYVRSVDFFIKKTGMKIDGLISSEIGDFPEIKSERIFLFPSKILFKTVTAILSKGKLGVLVPMEEQKQDSMKKWKKTGLDVIVDVLNPYRGASEMEEVFDIIKRENVNLIVLDCIGYNMKIKERIREITGKIVLLPRTLLARFIKELI
ncbi:MAG: AroM family protein [Acidobacteriota bacterium]